jgi:hypothetical protein
VIPAAHEPEHDPMVENEDLTTEPTFIDTSDLPPVRHLTYEEAWEMFDGMAHRYAGMSGDEFIRAWDAGEFDDDPEPVMIVAMMIDVIREP